MELYCRNPSCPGNGFAVAVEHPDDNCELCGWRFADGMENVLGQGPVPVEMDAAEAAERGFGVTVYPPGEAPDDGIPMLPLYETDSELVKLCTIAGEHSPEGRIHAAGHLLGRCQRCGIGLLEDGS